MTAGPVTVDAGLAPLGEAVWASERVAVIDLGIVAVRVVGTEHVTVDVRDPDAAREAGLPDLLAYGAVARILHTHAGRFCVHASLVTWDGAAVLVAGHRRAGKSTTVTKLSRDHGARLRIDDVVPLTHRDGRVLAHPFPRPVHLLPDAAARLGVAPHPDGRTVGTGDSTKHSVDLGHAGDPVPVTGLVLLTRRVDEPGPPLTVREVTGADRLRLVVRASNATGFASFGARAPRFVEWAISVASALPTLEIKRDPAADTLDQVTSTITDWAVRGFDDRGERSPDAVSRSDRRPCGQR